MLSVAGALAKTKSVAAHVRGSDVILARNLEMLVLGAIADVFMPPVQHWSMKVSIFTGCF